MQPALARISRSTALAAVLLAVAGFLALGRVDHGDLRQPSHHAALTSTSPSSTSTSGSTPTASRTSVGGARVTQPSLSPVDTVSPATVPTTVAPPPPTEAPAVESPLRCVAERLTVLPIEGCPVSTLIGAVVSVTQEAVAPPK